MLSTALILFILRDPLLPHCNLYSGHNAIIVMHNCQIYQHQCIPEMIEEVGCKLVMDSHYSADYDPRDIAFRVLKK